MSGGYFDYKQYQIDEIADNVERIVNAVVKKELPPTDVYSEDCNGWAKHLLAESSPATLVEFQKALVIFKQAAIYAQRIDWFLSGDDGEESFHKRLKEDLEELNAK